MPEPITARWPDGLPAGVHQIQARQAFGPGGRAYPARLFVFDSGIILERLPDGATEPIVVARPDRLTAILGRADLTCVRGAPLLRFSDEFGVLAIATGPATPPARLSVLSNVARLENGEAVEMPPRDETQPSWQLVAARRERVDDHA